MAEEFGTRDVFEQIDSRLGNVEQDIRTLGNDLRVEMKSLRSDVRSEIGGLQTEMNASSRWLSVMASIWLKP